MYIENIAMIVRYENIIILQFDMMILDMTVLYIAYEYMS